MEAPMAVVEEATGITTEVKIMKKRKRDCVMICEEAKEEVGIFFINKIDMKTVQSVSSKELNRMSVYYCAAVCPLSGGGYSRGHKSFQWVRIGRFRLCR